MAATVLGGDRRSVEQRLETRTRRELARLRTWPVRRRMADCGRYLFLGRQVEIVNPDRMHLGEAVVIESYALVACSREGSLAIGDGVFVGRGVVIAAGDCELTIGAGSGVGEYSSIRNTNHGIAPGERWQVQPQVCRPIRIGADVWIGGRCAILHGVTIGDGAVVGANSVVTHDVEPYAVVAGAPARAIRHRR